MGLGPKDHAEAVAHERLVITFDAHEDIEVVGEAADRLEAIAKPHELGALALPPNRDSCAGVGFVSLMADM